MPGMPELPVNVPRDQVQVDGEIDKEPVYQTHRGKKPTHREAIEQGKPRMSTPDGPLRYEEE